jgi:hypothetical protein
MNSSIFWCTTLRNPLKVNDVSEETRSSASEKSLTFNALYRKIKNCRVAIPEK